MKEVKVKINEKEIILKPLKLRGNIQLLTDLADEKKRGVSTELLVERTLKASGLTDKDIDELVLDAGISNLIEAVVEVNGFGQ